MPGLLILAPARAVASAPSGFFGVVPQGPLSSQDFDRIGNSGLAIRMQMYWPEIEPNQGEFNFRGLDQIFEESADRGIRVLPVLYGSPAWIASDSARPPLSPSALTAWRTFVGKMVSRYGPRGDFWVGRARRSPVHRWQVWNEPNFRLFWRPRPSPRAYARLLHTTVGAIKRVDPGASILTAGVAPVEHEVAPWEFLRRLFAVPGAARDIDQVALHPYASTLTGVEYQVRRTRQAMARAGLGRIPLVLTELGVASAASIPTTFNLGLSGQARFLERSFERLRRQRRRWRIGGVFWFAWQDVASPDSYCAFCQHAGLFDLAGAPKPAWLALRRLSGAAQLSLAPGLNGASWGGRKR